MSTRVAVFPEVEHARHHEARVHLGRPGRRAAGVSPRGEGARARRVRAPAHREPGVLRPAASVARGHRDGESRRLAEVPRGLHEARPPLRDARARGGRGDLRDRARVPRRRAGASRRLARDRARGQGSVRRPDHLLGELGRLRPGHVVGRGGHHRHRRLFRALDDRLPTTPLTRCGRSRSCRGPTLSQIVDGWKPIKAALKAFSERYSRPIFFTEVGYTTFVDTAYHPWMWQSERAVDPSQQALCYRALFRPLPASRGGRAPACGASTPIRAPSKSGTTRLRATRPKRS